MGKLFDRGCDLVILACNTASAAALRRMQEGWVPHDKRVLGVFVPLIEALTERQWGDNSPPREVAVKHVALFATPATVASRAFQRELAFRAIGVDVESQACGGVVDAIEDGDMILAEALVRSHVDALKRKMPEPDAAVLGCTHYPLVEAVFRDALGPGVKVFLAAGSGGGIAGSLPDAAARDGGRRRRDGVPDVRQACAGIKPRDAVPAARDHLRTGVIEPGARASKQMGVSWRVVVVVAALIEIATGLALLVAPHLAGDLLIGADIGAAGAVVTRIAGLGLLSFGIACWPGPAVAGMLVYNAGVALYLALCGVTGVATGALVWPVVAVHVVIALLLARGWRRARSAECGGRCRAGNGGKAAV